MSSTGKIELIELPNLEYLSDIVDIPNVRIIDRIHLDEIVSDISENQSLLQSRIHFGFAKPVAWKLAKRLGSLFSNKWDIPETAIAEAFLFPLWTEYSTILTMRMAARRILRDGSTACYIPVKSMNFEFFDYWNATDTALLYLAYELSRHNCPVSLVVQKTKLQGQPKLSIALAKRFRPTASFRIPSFKLSKEIIVCDAGVRGIPNSSAKIRSAPRVRHMHSGRRTMFNHSLYSMFRLPQRKKTIFAPELVRENELMRVYELELSERTALTAIEESLGPMTKAGWTGAKNLVRSLKVENTLICEHPFFESALLAAATKHAGGKVTLLPHSTNPIMPLYRSEASFDKVVAGTKHSRGTWAHFYPQKSTYSKSAMVLNASQPTSKFDAKQPLTIVIVGGANRLGHLPILCIPTHLKTYNVLLDSDHLAASNCKLIFQPKHGWEDENWIRRTPHLEVAKDIIISRTPIPRLNYPNMVFVSVTMASSALLESAIRGIPSILVSDQTVENYVPLEASPIDTISSASFWAYIRDLGQQERYNQLAGQQNHWVRSNVYEDSYMSPNFPSD